MKSQNKVSRIFGALILVVILATACGPAATETAIPPLVIPPTLAPGEPTNTPPAEVITLDVMHFYGEGVADQPMMVVWGKQFEALYPQYKIKWTWGGSEAMTLFQARMNSNDPPDIFIANDAQTAVMARSGIIQPVDQYLTTNSFEGDAVWKDTFQPVIENGYIADGKLGAGYYGIPDNMHFGGIFYNKGMFAENNYQIPQTWDELLALCDQIQTNQNIPCFGADFTDSYNEFPLNMIWWRLVGAQKTYETGMGKEGTSFNTPEFLRGAQLFQELTTKYYQPGWEGNQWPSGQVQFANNGEAMIFMPSWLPSELMNVSAEGFTLGMFPMPIIPDGYTGTPDLEVKFNGWVLPVGSKHPDDMMVFIKFVTSQAYQLARSQRASLNSPLKVVPLAPTLADMTTALETSNPVRFSAGLDADASEWESKVYFPLCDQLALGQITPEEFVQQLDEQTKAFYGK